MDYDICTLKQWANKLKLAVTKEQVLKAYLWYRPTKTNPKLYTTQNPNLKLPVPTSLPSPLTKPVLPENEEKDGSRVEHLLFAMN